MLCSLNVKDAKLLQVFISNLKYSNIILKMVGATSTLLKQNPPIFLVMKQSRSLLFQPMHFIVS
jgi:hypothetical protein